MFIHDESFQFRQLKQCNLPSGRVYQVAEGPDAGAVYPSITRVLGKKEKPELEAWKKRVGPEEAALQSARATVQGQNLHKLGECYLLNQNLPRHMPHIAELWYHLRPWIDEHITKVYAQEQDIYSEKLGVAGRMDLLFEYAGSFLCVGDFKSSKQFKKEAWVKDYFLQGTFYSVAVYEQTGRLPKKIILPIVSPTGLQVFEATPSEHFEELLDRVSDFYANYVKEENVVDAAVDS